MTKKSSGGSGSQKDDGRTVHYTDWDGDYRRSWDEDARTGERSGDYIVDQRTGEKQDIPSDKKK